ncbi:sulfur carrier protein ThiS family protein [Candidatus Nitrosoglobus terrae]|uniref:Sulfur carrier protein ThiS family protein n=1 Tax=Candidatus Nitrosoglobus terrae TaxID=1630141 RepID=A0A1Q2SN95_9GAMM|nr:ThiF family adenylyltransferase [Candidatus Nitrosoglobus terrae]BAW80604.1 sulfur carrier protein ThiS family protein [Candidatus Nitrosoglobus terrae]
MTNFDYDTAFMRNRGFISLSEQQKLKQSRVAIAGLGGTGGAQLAALSRLGIGRFNLADLDEYELKNFNRQYGATMKTLGEQKTTVAQNIVQDINPDACVKIFDSGIHSGNIELFLEEVDIVVDSLDFYCFKERFLLYAAAKKKGLWVLTSPPLGFGFTLLCFDPTGMGFEEYFNFNPHDSEFELSAAFIAGLAPKAYMFRYLDQAGLDIDNHQLPSVSPAPFIIAGVIATQVCNLLLSKVKPVAVPTVIQYDALLHIYKKHQLRWGMKGPLQRIKKMILQAKLRKAKPH